jgi:hypothetical protein
MKDQIYLHKCVPTTAQGTNCATFVHKSKSELQASALGGGPRHGVASCCHFEVLQQSRLTNDDGFTDARGGD